MKKITDADKARLKKLTAGKGALANGKLSMDEQLEFNALKRKERQATAYSPRPMSAADKAKASARGKATAARTKPKSLASKVVNVAGKIVTTGAKALAKDSRPRGMASNNATRPKGMGKAPAKAKAQKDSIRKMVEKGSKVNLDKPKPGDVAILRQRIAKDQFEGARAADKKSAPKKNAGVRK
jgi:hypothetical protein